MVPPQKVFAVHRALADAGLPHAIGGAIALSIYGVPRPTTDIDVNVNVFVGPERRPEVRAALDPLRLDSHRKALLDRPKDRLDIEALLRARPDLDVAEIVTWLDRLGDPAIRGSSWRVRDLLRSRD